jgi:hypothetical protein
MSQNDSVRFQHETSADHHSRPYDGHATDASVNHTNMITTALSQFSLKMIWQGFVVIDEITIGKRISSHENTVLVNWLTEGEVVATVSKIIDRDLVLQSGLTPI